MSKSIVLPLAIIAAPALAAAGLLAVAGMGAVWAANRGKQFWDDLSPEDRKFLLPFGAERDRIQLQTATVDSSPMEGFDFASNLPSFAATDASELDQQYLPVLSDGAAGQLGLQQTQALQRLESEARALGFSAQRRQMSAANGLIVLDLSAMAEANPDSRVPLMVRSR